MKRRPMIVLALLLGLWVVPTGAGAQGGDSCPTIVQAALSIIDEHCGETTRNQACYGSDTIQADAQPDSTGFHFEQPGDRIDVAAIRTLRLSAMDIASEEWGTALLQVQANLPDTLPGQNVTFLLFGDVHLTNAANVTETLAMTTTTPVNVRLRPRSDRENVIGSLPPGTDVIATGRATNNFGETWIRIRYDEHIEHTGWVVDWALHSDEQTSVLADIEPGTPAWGPMQAFYLTTGLGDAPCTEAPDSGLLIQTPAGQAAVRLAINEVTVDLGSTVYLQAQAGGEMTVTTLDGSARLTTFGVTQTAPAGTKIVVPLDADGAASGPPGPPQPYEADALQALVSLIDLLPQPIVIAAALTQDEIDALVNQPETETIDETEESAGPADVGPDDACTIVPDSTVNLRGGPGTNYPLHGRLDAGQAANPDGQAVGNDGLVWWRLPGDSWVRSDIVQPAGNCDLVPEVQVPAPPTESPPAASSSASNDLFIPTCASEFGGGPYLAGQTIRITIGVRLPTDAPASDLDGHTATITVDGVPLDLYYAGVSWHVGRGVPDGWGNAAIGNWVATPGTHTIAGSWTVPESWSGSCVITIP